MEAAIINIADLKLDGKSQGSAPSLYTSEERANAYTIFKTAKDKEEQLLMENKKKQEENYIKAIQNAQAAQQQALQQQNGQVPVTAGNYGVPASNNTAGVYIESPYSNFVTPPLSEGETLGTPFTLTSYETGEFKSYMAWTAITNQSSRQWAYQHDGNAYNGEHGFRMYKGRYMIACSEMFGTIGQKLNVTIGGTTIPCIIGDVKKSHELHDGYVHHDGSIIEFIIDNDTLDPVIKNSGNGGKIFPGPIQAIVPVY